MFPRFPPNLTSQRLLMALQDIFAYHQRRILRSSNGNLRKDDINIEIPNWMLRNKRTEGGKLIGRLRRSRVLSALNKVALFC